VRVDFGCGGLFQHIVHQARLGGGVDSWQGHGLVLRRAEAQVVVVGVVGCGQNGQVAVDCRLDFGHAVAARGSDGGKGGVDGRQIAAGHTGDACVAVGQFNRYRSTGIACRVIADERQRSRLGVDDESTGGCA
jgi:hypothetical protein